MAIYEMEVKVENEEENTLETVSVYVKTDSLAYAEISAITQVREDCPYTHGDVLTVERKG